MNWIILKFKIWRRKPYKSAMCRAYEKGFVDSRQFHQLMALIDQA